jgi:acetyl-CoA carboxylase biotin carboxyl carrier protein
MRRQSAVEGVVGMAANASRQRTEKRGTAIPPAIAAGPNGNAHAGAQPMMDLDFLRGLIEAVDQSGIDTLEIHRAGTRIRIAKTPAPTAVIGAAMTAQPAAGHALGAATLPAVPPAAAPVPEAVTALPQSNLIEIKSPMVGTFYRAPAPEAPPYVEIGSHVSKGQTLCILEAMKLMNELESEVDGVIREVLVDNADPVEYGQVLFRIEPAAR